MNEAQGSEAVGVVLPAAGRGTRLGGTRKQLRTLGGAPVLIQTARLFERHTACEAIVVPTDPALIERVDALVREAGLGGIVSVVGGGDTRQTSVAAGVSALPDRLRYVLVHDAVRPFAPDRLIREIIDAVRRHGAAAAAIPVSDTVRRVESGRFRETVDRRGLYRMQTPQAFRREWLTDALGRAKRENISATDDVALVQRSGHGVYLVEGDARNIKITTPADWELARMLWEQKVDD